MRILVINPNTSAEITEKVLLAAREACGPGVELIGATGRFGARYVASRASYAIAGHAALDAYATEGAGADAVALACFGDPGLDALREIADVPVAGMAEASMLAAAQLAPAFGIVTGGRAWAPMLREFAHARGLRGRLAAIETVEATGAAIARDPDAALGDLAAACRRAAVAGAGAVILGGAGLAGLAAPLAARTGLRIVDSVAALMGQAQALAALQAGSAPAPPGLASTGLSPALAARL